MPSDFGFNPFAASGVVCLVSRVPPPSVAMLAPPSEPDHPVVPDLPSALLGGPAGSVDLPASLVAQSFLAGGAGACPLATVAQASRLNATERRRRIGITTTLRNEVIIRKILLSS